MVPFESGGEARRAYFFDLHKSNNVWTAQPITIKKGAEFFTLTTKLVSRWKYSNLSKS